MSWPTHHFFSEAGIHVNEVTRKLQIMGKLNNLKTSLAKACNQVDRDVATSTHNAPLFLSRIPNHKHDLNNLKATSSDNTITRNGKLNLNGLKKVSFPLTLLFEPHSTDLLTLDTLVASLASLDAIIESLEMPITLYGVALPHARGILSPCSVPVFPFRRKHENSSRTSRIEEMNVLLRMLKDDVLGVDIG